MECNFIDLELHLHTSNRAKLAASLHALGGCYAGLCRCAACPIPDSDCHACSLSLTCDWHRVFGQALSVDPEALRRHQKPPLPFVFSFPLPGEAPESSGILVCGLVVIGCAVSSLGMLLDGFKRFLSDNAGHGRAELVQLFSRDYQGTAIPLVRGEQPSADENLTVLSLRGIMESHAWNSRQIVINLLAPLKLRVDDHQVRQFAFGPFARALLRRVSSLVYYYEKCEPENDFKSLSRQADQVTCTTDAFGYDSSPGGMKKLSGIVGRGCFTGDFNELMPFLVAGTYLHVGKHSAFGLGRFSLSSP